MSFSCTKNESILIWQRSCFAALNDTERCDAFRHLANIPCAAHGSLVATRSQDGSLLQARCYLCEGVQKSGSSDLNEERRQKISSEAIETFSKLVKSAAFLDARRPRVLAMIALRSFTAHFTDEAFLDFERSVLGQWCLQSLRSSIRELRIAAGYANFWVFGASYSNIVIFQPHFTRLLAWSGASE